jgi:hypothetical protein
MNKTVIINGSPKAKGSASSIFIDKIKKNLINPIVYQASQIIQEKDSTNLSDILNADVLLFVFPLYVDSLPAPLIKVLTMIEQKIANKSESVPIVYAICNCGFFEAKHTRLALDILKNFSISSGMSWGYGIGIGAGGLIASESENMAKGPATDVYTVLLEFAKDMQNEVKKENVFVTANMPRFLYKFGGNLSWYQMAMKNGPVKPFKVKPQEYEK